MIDILIVIVIAGVTWCVASGGAHGAVTTFFSTLFAAIIAMNFFEPIAGALSGALGMQADMVALLGIFAGLAFGFRFAADSLSPRFVAVHAYAHEGIRWVGGLMTGYLVAAMLLIAVHVSPFPERFLGFEPLRRNLFDISAPDRQFLGFFQYLTEKPFGSRNGRIFDGRTAVDWQVPRAAVDINPSEVVMPDFVVRYASRRGNLSGPAMIGPGAPSQSAPARSGPNF
ncbi:CvpA family protein [Stratiformator vulcanicus]|uniref:Colicin V production protein n=1 Tax=Stratiformator vulcanicus TaxID=2527980 RepID=A0A517R4H8_9PLAN|nr:CvpA family protein [Stratiformator vulcanicus]QDT38776.1 hypothetical protein Pan189_31740 [Stratiformator vulcanicus]